jgi:carbonic anhydrase
MSHHDENNNTTIDYPKLGHEWGYEGNYGPSHWHHKYPLAASDKQSPIDINTQQANYDSQLEANQLTFSYDSNNFTHIVNTGSSFKVSGASDAKSSKFLTSYKHYNMVFVFFQYNSCFHFKRLLVDLYRPNIHFFNFICSKQI